MITSQCATNVSTSPLRSTTIATSASCGIELATIAKANTLVSVAPWSVSTAPREKAWCARMRSTQVPLSPYLCISLLSYANATDTGFFIRKDPKRPEESTLVTFIAQVDQMGLFPAWLRDKMNEEQATYICNIRHAMERVISAEGMKICLLEKDMFFRVRTKTEDQSLVMWAFNHDNLNEVMSISRTRRINKRIVPLADDHLYSNLGNKMIQVISDTHGEEATYQNGLVNWRPYSESDAEEIFRTNCEELRETMMNYGLSPPDIPLPWPLWVGMQVDGVTYTCRPTHGSAGAVLRMQALQNMVVVVATSVLMGDGEKRHHSNVDLSSSLKSWTCDYKLDRARAFQRRMDLIEEHDNKWYH